MKHRNTTRLCLAISTALAANAAFAGPQTFSSARSFAMGGTGVAVAHPAEAAADNPAMMASNQNDWSDDFGLILPSINARVADEEKVVDQVDDIQTVIDQFEQQIRSGTAPETVQKTAADLRDRLVSFDQDKMRANLGLGLALSAPSQSFAVGAFTNGTLVMTVEGEVSTDDRTLLDNIVNASDATDAQNKIDAATDSNGNLNLTSKGKVLAAAVAEVGLSFARQFELQNGANLQVGVSPKYVQLKTFQYTETVSGFDDNNFDSDNNTTDKSGFNLDLGTAYTFGERQQWNLGVVAKNLIPMELDSAASRPDLDEKVRTLELNPTVTAGIAHTGDFHVLTAELDLTKNKAFGFEDDTQWLALGAELDAWRYAQLRFGVRQNLASNDNNDGIEEKTQYTAGFGLNLMGLRLDLAGLYSNADVGAALELGTSF
ncbi:conjugal transfer protein TraF [Marinobacter koreensis]|uniref:Conjugal transfer protein TraF n=1 Tax=Marinobacter koreensis TaxID=335974 RepID=A0ABW0RL40_9GAMM|nr:conjugal transfer protein TraF [Marinobacter koreensis]MCK7546499.1 conjugal transfer protein TraF [Marinobacter koreensis]